MTENDERVLVNNLRLLPKTAFYVTGWVAHQGPMALYKQHRFVVPAGSVAEAEKVCARVEELLNKHKTPGAVVITNYSADRPKRNPRYFLFLGYPYDRKATDVVAEVSLDR